MKTAVQHIIEYLEQNDLNQDTLHFANLMLEKEKQDLIEAFKEGYRERELEDLDMDEYADFEDYYNQTFKQ
jgi:phosphosulfolactate phosphohydrolase-like enzyme